MIIRNAVRFDLGAFFFRGFLLGKGAEKREKINWCCFRLNSGYDVIIKSSSE